MKRILCLATFLLYAWAACLAVADETEKPPPLSEIDVSLVDGDAIAFATFQSHNQKVVSNQHGIFLTYLRGANKEYLAQTWRLSHTPDQGQTFTTLFEATHPTNPPLLETDQGGQLFLIRPDFVDQSA